jgi:hypothetical protein
MRRGQSSVEPLLGFTAVIFAGLLLCWFNMARLQGLVYEASLWFEGSKWFDDAARLVGQGDA